MDHQRRVHERFQCATCCTRFVNFSSFYFHKLNCHYRRGYMSTAKNYWRCDACQWYFKLQLGLENHRKRRICRKVESLRRLFDQRRPTATHVLVIEADTETSTGAEVSVYVHLYCF